MNEQERKQNLEELLRDTGNAFDNISITDTTVSYADTTDAREHYARFNTNLSVLKRIFGTYENFDDIFDEENAIFLIEDSKNINWSEVSCNKSLPEFIMEEFSIQLNWLNIFLNRRMTTKTVELFKLQLKKVTEKGDFISHLNDVNLSATNVLLKVNSDLIDNVFLHACTYDYEEMVKILLEHVSDKMDIIRHGFVIAGYSNSTKVFDLLLDNHFIDNDYINSIFVETTDRIIKNSGNDNEAHRFLSILLDKCSINYRNIEHTFSNACYYNNYKLAEIILSKNLINDNDIKKNISRAVGLHMIQLLDILLDKCSPDNDNTIINYFSRASDNKDDWVIQALMRKFSTNENVMDKIRHYPYIRKHFT